MYPRPIRALLSGALSASLLLSLAVLPASALTASQDIQVDYKNITVTLDGQAVALTDAGGAAVEPFAYQSTTYLPLRAVAGALGLKVEWQAASNTVVLTSGGARAAASGLPANGTIGPATIRADFKDIAVTLDGTALTLTDANGAAVEPFACNGTIYLPVRAVAGALGLEVTWDAASSTVALASAATSTPTTGGQDDVFTAEDAAVYVKGILDEWYQGACDEQFMTLLAITPEEVQANYLNSVQVEVDGFNDYVGIDYPEDINDRMVALWKQISAKVGYTIGSVTGPDAGGTYSVHITILPVDIYKLVDEAYPAFSEQFEARFADVDVDSMTDTQYFDWFQNEYDKVYRDGFCDLLETLLPKLGHLPEQSMTIRLELESDGLYGLNSADNTSLANSMIPYTY